jgi:hypothetical protein
MSFSSSYTPNPTSTTQIGYSTYRTITPVTGISGTSNISTSDIPQGIILFIGYIKSSRPNNAFGTTQGYIQAYISPSLIFHSSFQNQNGFNCLETTLTFGFYNNGTEVLSVEIGISGLDDSTTSGSYTLTKIA